VKPPRVSAKECQKALAQVGFYFVSQESSHIKLRRDDPYAQVIVPNQKELAAGTLRSILKSAGLTIEQFIELL
jgi:predicted RNA binding protein YcfA (HicA-like mRNA interferase family)